MPTTRPTHYSHSLVRSSLEISQSAKVTVSPKHSAFVDVTDPEDLAHGLKIGIYQTPRAENVGNTKHQRIHRALVSELRDVANFERYHDLPNSLHAHHLYEVQQVQPLQPKVREFVLASKAQKAFAIRIFDTRLNSAFKLKILAGGVNVASPESQWARRPQHHFIAPEQEWVWGVNVSGSDAGLARQFEVLQGVFGKSSLRSLIYGNNDVQTVEIQIFRAAGEVIPPEGRDLPTFSITVTLMGNSIMIHGLRGSTTILEVKQMIEDKKGIDPYYQRLVKGGESFELDASRFTFTQDTKLFLVLTLRGGGGGMAEIGVSGLVKQRVAVDLAPGRWMKEPFQTLKFHIVDAKYFKALSGITPKIVGENYGHQLSREDTFFSITRPIIKDTEILDERLNPRNQLQRRVDRGRSIDSDVAQEDAVITMDRVETLAKKRRRGCNILALFTRKTVAE
ncbi:hypothetical protein GQ44DRAFT_719969 [Phaeosphaeriaceae sp. PMI808]|nr:hypothetical protein GQ44DRAFT_719969 [Phaeosphaeriaceae sp. PMI808]